MIQILLADDHPIIRQGLRALLTSYPDFKVIGEAETGVEAVQAAERLRPNIIVMDVMMPDMDGLEAIRHILARCPNIRIIVLSMVSSEECVLEALRTGASGYILKSSAGDELLRGVQEVAKGRRFLSPLLSERAFDVYVQHTTTPADAFESLSLREREILQLVVAGRTSKEIGAKLRLSVRTIEGHRASIMKKLNADTHMDLLRFAEERSATLFKDTEAPPKL